jgi:hypothetical protein
MKPYEAAFAPNQSVSIKNREFLESFKATWKLHNPLQDEQLEFASRPTIVKEVGYYHGGDPLYVLRDIPGVWHEGCLQKA